MWATLDGIRFPEISEPGEPTGSLPPAPEAPVRFAPSESWVSDMNQPTDISAWTANAVMTAGETTFPDPAALSEDGILVTVFQVGDEPPAPDNPNFPPASLPLDLPEEIETSWEGYTEGRSRSTLLVAVNGRALQIHVYYGTTEPSEEMLVEAEAALERLIVEPVPAPPALPPPVRDDYRSEFVSNERGYRFWPRSAPVEPVSSIGSRCHIADWDGSSTSMAASGRGRRSSTARAGCRPTTSPTATSARSN